MSDLILVVLTSLDCTMQGRVLCWTGAMSHVSNTGPAVRPQRLGRSEGRPIEGWFLRWKCPAHERCLKSWGRMITTHTDSCRIKRHPALPFIWRLWQRSAVSYGFDIRGNRWREALKHKGIIHWTNGTSGCCIPWWQWLVDLFLKGCLPLCG